MLMRPLVVGLYIEDDYLVVMNHLRRKNFVKTSNQQGAQQHGVFITTFYLTDHL